jgi:hypothetical protein
VPANRYLFIAEGIGIRRCAAAFATLAGVAPLQPCSGNSRHHPLNRGSDRRTPDH